MTTELPPAIELYFRDIAAIPLLTAEQEQGLAVRIQSGDESAEDILIRSNLRLVAKMAKDFTYTCMPMQDIISAGNVGLMRAAKSFEPSRGKFSTYAAWWIMQAIKREAENTSRTVRLPSHVVQKVYRLRRAEMHMRDQLDRDPTDEEIASELGVKESVVSAMKRYSQNCISLSAPIGDGTMFAGDLIPDESATDPEHMASHLDMLSRVSELFAQLPEKKRRILEMRFGLNGGEPMTLEEVGKVFGVTRERIRQTQNEALAMLRFRAQQSTMATGQHPEYRDGVVSKRIEPKTKRIGRVFRVDGDATLHAVHNSARSAKAACGYKPKGRWRVADLRAESPVCPECRKIKDFPS